MLSGSEIPRTSKTGNRYTKDRGSSCIASITSILVYYNNFLFLFYAQATELRSNFLSYIFFKCSPQTAEVQIVDFVPAQVAILTLILLYCTQLEQTSIT